MAIFILMVLSLVALELGARAAAHLTYADVWLKEPLLQRKDDQMRRLARSQPEVLFLGSSGTMCAVDPAVLSSEYGISAYNAGVFRGNMSYLARWATDFALRRLEPRIVVIEIWPTTINDNSEMVAPFAEYLAAPYFTVRRRVRFLYEAGYWMTILRLLPLVAAPVRLSKLVGRTLTNGRSWTLRRPLSLPGVIGPRGESIEHDSRSDYRTGPRLQAALHDLTNDWTVGGPEWAALVSLVRTVTATGARVFLFEPPCTADLPSKYFPGGTDAWQAATRQLERMCEQLDATWIRPEHPMVEQEYFVDAVHANLAGKYRFSMAIGESLARERGMTPLDRPASRAARP